MTQQPSIVHAAADLHREALLTEAKQDRRTVPASARTQRAGPVRACRRLVACGVALLSRIVDDFESLPPSDSPITERLGTKIRP